MVSKLQSFKVFIRCQMILNILL